MHSFSGIQDLVIATLEHEAAQTRITRERKRCVGDGRKTPTSAAFDPEICRSVMVRSFSGPLKYKEAECTVGGITIANRVVGGRENSSTNAKVYLNKVQKEFYEMEHRRRRI